MDLKAWLEEIGCGAHVDAFTENSVTTDLLPDLTDEDLRELGLNIGERKRFRRAIAALESADGEGAEAPGATPARKSAEEAPEAQPPHAERRRLTVMFIDMVGSTVLSSKLDPEAWADVLREYQDCVAGVVSRFGGHIGQYLGDGVLCYFGWPKAHEDSAERAVSAALEMVRSVSRISTLEEPLSCRIGIATGLVVVGDLIGRDDGADLTAIGETLNFTARLQAFAKSDQIVISQSTRRLLGNAFILESLGERSFKGITGKQKIYAVTGENPEHDRFLARAGLQAGQIVGRENEIALLIDRWAMTRDGEGQTVSLVGEAGIGKSRITRALFEEIASEPHSRISYQCSPYHRDTALWPVIAQLTATIGAMRTSAGEDKLDLLEKLLGGDGDADMLGAALIADLLGLDGEARYGPITLPPAARRESTFRALLHYLLERAKETPLILLIEDTHWADPTTLEFINLLIDHQAQERLMILMTTRPENDIRLPSHAYVSSVTLNRLGRQRVEEIIDRLGGGHLPPETVEAIIERTDGVPLFVEELTKVMLESGAISVPASLHDTLMARLDRLPDVKEVAQIASVFGREFEADPLALVARMSEQKVGEALDKLREVELVFFKLGTHDRHLFKHALVRDAAYESLLNRHRQEIHGRIFDVLKQSEGVMPGVLAQHAAEAGRTTEAVRFGRIAAEQALRRPAYAEAIAHIDAALRVLETCKPGDPALEERRDLLLLSGQARIAHYGYAARSTVDTYAEIERIARETDDTILLVGGLYGRWAGDYVPGRLPIALTIADTICEASAKTEDTLARALGHRLRGTVLTMMGRLEEGATALDEAETYYDAKAHAPSAARFGQDVGIAAKCYRIGVLTLEGRFDQASSVSREVITALEHVNHAHTSGYALGHLACFLSAAEITPLGNEVAQKCIEIGERDRMPLWSALGKASLGMAHVHEGHGADSIEEIREALATLDTLDFNVFRPILLAPFAIALGRAGKLTEAAGQITEAKELVVENEACFFEPEIYRAEGILAALQGNHLNAAACFEHAIARAQELGHLASQLRAADNLADLYSETGRLTEGLELLASVYERFTEGHSTPALKRVAAKIGQLA